MVVITDDFKNFVFKTLNGFFEISPLYSATFLT